MKDNFRNRNVDFIKGISILGVVFIHGSWLAGNTGWVGQILEDTSRLAVPLFIVLFCYFTEKGVSKDGRCWPYLTKRFNALLLPFLFWSLIYFLLLADWRNLTVAKALTRHWSGYGWSGQYFFLILFQIIVFFPILRLLAARRGAVAVTFTLTAIVYAFWSYFPANVPSILQKLGARPVIYWVPYAFLGILLARDTKFPKFKWQVLFIAIVPLEHAFLADAGGSGPYFKISLLVAALLACPAFMQWPTFPDSKPGKLFIQFSRGSLAIFLLNPLIILGLAKFEFFPLKLPVYIGLPAALIIATLISCCALGIRYVMNKTVLRACI